MVRPDRGVTADMALSSTQVGLSPVRTVLENGVVVIAKETRKTPVVALNIAVRTGSVNDPPDAPGAMHLLARVMDRGTTSRSAADIAEALDDRGISLNTLVTRHQLTAVCTCLAEDFDFVLDLVADVIMSPTVPDAELVTRKREIVTAIRQDDDNPYVKALETLMASLYGPTHPYGRPAKGTIAAIESMSRERIARLHAGCFSPDAVTAVIVGDVDADRAVGAAERAFGGWQRRSLDAATVPKPTRASSRRRLVIPMMNKSQADIAYGFVSIARTDPRYYAYWLMNNALGQYAIGGRLGDSIRERQGMAYYVGSSLDANLVEGPLSIRAGVNPANVDRAVMSIDEELTRLRQNGLTQKELDESRQFLIGSMPRALETNAGIANFLQMAEFFDLGSDYDVRLPALLKRVTLEDANEAARDAVDPDRATVVIAGPYEDR